MTEPRADTEQRFARTWQPVLWAKLIALALIGAYVIAFIVANDERVDVNFLFASPRASLIWVILVSLALGIVVGVLISQLYSRRGGR